MLFGSFTVKPESSQPVTTTKCPLLVKSPGPSARIMIAPESSAFFIDCSHSGSSVADSPSKAQPTLINDHEQPIPGTH